MSVLIFDTETTSKEPDREIIEAAYIVCPEVNDMAGVSDRIPRPLIGPFDHFEQRYRPETPTTFGALAVHNILPSELEDCPPASTFALPAGVEYIVGHSIDFDWEAAGSPPGVKRIDTCCIARWLWPDADSHSQSALLYMLLGPTPETRELLKGAHGALTDVLNNARLLEKILEAKPEIETWSALWEYSEACRIPRTMPIGEKQGLKGMLLDEAVEADLGFVQWCLRQDWIDDYLRRGLNEAIARVDAKWNAAPEPDNRPACQRDKSCVLVAGHDGDCMDDIPF
jgi:exodeoxyribonuclease X